MARFPTEASNKCGTVVAITGRLFERPTFRLREFRFLKIHNLCGSNDLRITMVVGTEIDAS